MFLLVNLGDVSENSNATAPPRLSTTALLILGLSFKAFSAALNLEGVVKSLKNPNGKTLSAYCAMLLFALAM
jgi:hypothetical protein